ncbi:hypothetical protein EG68_07276 [Paragonimus skrjabini miyazakii]|uniref:Uncharacterized protein n=1 Tax=Paragonimus skrjabini miyazakii TaxID=59628 RepID=A0A8S9YF32_9TREM|nr:hypothetical protein EG68_07276 [Paragonimus skrjabini miyazakii]
MNAVWIVSAIMLVFVQHISSTTTTQPEITQNVTESRSTYIHPNTTTPEPLTKQTSSTTPKKSQLLHDYWSYEERSPHSKKALAYKTLRTLKPSQIHFFRWRKATTVIVLRRFKKHPRRAY